MTIFALQAKKCPKLAFFGVLGEFCTGCADEGPVLGEFCTGVAREEVCRASLYLRRLGVMTLEVGVSWLGVQ